MARRLMVILMSAMILVGFVSCDLSGMMKAMSPNIAGANPDKINRVEEQIDTIWGEEGSDGAKPTSDGVKIGSVDLSQFADDVTTYLGSLDEESFKSLTSAIAQAAANESGKKALQNSLSKPLGSDDTEKINATKGSATIITNMIEKITGADNETDVKNQLGSATSDNGMPKELRSLFYNLVDGLYDVAEYSQSPDKTMSNGDVVIMQTVYTVLNNVSDVIFISDGTIDETTGLPPMNENIAEDKAALSDLIDQVNMGIQVIDAVAPASNFGDLQLEDILSDLLESLDESEEGSN